MKNICFIHGLNSSANSFNFVYERLKCDDVVFHKINYDSHQPLVESLTQVIKQLPRGKKVSLVGHSLGGVIATLVANECAAQVEKLVTISAPLNGSRAAATLRWLPGSSPVLSDIMPSSKFILQCGELNLEVPTISIISTGGHLPTSGEPNDSVVAVSSQRGLKFGRKVEIKASHFEILMSEKTIKTLSDFLLKDEK